MSSTTGRPGSLRSLARLATALTAVAVLAAACGSSDSGSEAALSSGAAAAAKAAVKAAEQEPTTIAATKPLSKAPPRDKLVVFLNGGGTNNDETLGGLTQGAEVYGWTIKSLTINPGDISTVNTGLLQALTLKADYVVLPGFPEAQLSKSTLAKFKDAGVKIIIPSTTPVPRTETLLGLSADTNSRILAGKQLADWFVDDSKGKGKAVIFNVTTYPNLTVFVKSFEDQVKKTCPACRTKTVSVTFGDVVSGALPPKVVSELRTDRSFEYAVFDNSLEITGLDPALQAAGLTKIKVIGHSMDPVTVKSLTSGQAKAFIAISFRYAGLDSMDTAYRDSVGDSTAQTPDMTVPSRLITKANVDQVPADGNFQAPKDALEQFTKLWLAPSA